MGIVVKGVIGRADFSVPDEFRKLLDALCSKAVISDRDFIDLCLLAVELIDDHWDMRTGMAYHIAGVWLSSQTIREGSLLYQIGGEFGTLELPDYHVAGTEEQVREKWRDVAKLVRSAEQQFTEKE